MVANPQVPHPKAPLPKGAIRNHLGNGKRHPSQCTPWGHGIAQERGDWRSSVCAADHGGLTCFYRAPVPLLVGAHRLHTRQQTLRHLVCRLRSRFCSAPDVVRRLVHRIEHRPVCSARVSLSLFPNRRHVPCSKEACPLNTHTHTHKHTSTQTCIVDTRATHTNTQTHKQTNMHTGYIYIYIYIYI